MAATIFGRMSPESFSSTSRPSSSCPSARASDAHAAAKASRPISFRSRRAHGCSSGLGALTVRMNPSGSPRSTSRRANASKGLVVTTPPKSNITARIATRSPEIGPIMGPRHDMNCPHLGMAAREEEEGVMDLDLLDLNGRASDWTSTKVGGATWRLDEPTTCDGWDVRTLLNHMLQTQRYFVGAARGEDVAPPGGTPPDVSSDKPRADFASAR